MFGGLLPAVLRAGLRLPNERVSLACFPSEQGKKQGTRLISDGSRRGIALRLRESLSRPRQVLRRR